MNKKLLSWIFIAVFFISLNFGMFDINGYGNIVSLIGFVVMMFSALGTILLLDNNTSDH